MAEMTYPLDNVLYNASGAELFHCTRNSGIYANNSFEYSITGADNIMTIDKGIAWIRNAEFTGKVYANTSSVALELDVADSTQARIDVVLIRFDSGLNKTYLTTKKGTPSSNPQIPTRSVTPTVYELYLYSILRPVGTVVITQNNIQDLRLSSYCGLMGDSITEINTTAINNQVEALIEDLQKAIDDVSVGSGIMLTSVYDPDQDGVVNLAEHTTQETTQDMDIYVSTSGNNNNNGDISSPVQTLAEALSRIPTIVNHNISIILTGTSTYSGNWVLSNKTGSGTITITSDRSVSSTYSYPTISILPQVKDCNISKITFEKLKFSQTVSSSDNISNVTGNITFSNCSFTAIKAVSNVGTSALRLVSAQDCMVENCVFNGDSNGINVLQGSEATLYNIEGKTSYRLGRVENGGKVFLMTYPTGTMTIIENINSGIVVYPNGTDAFELYSNSSGTNGTIYADFSQYKRLIIYFFRDSGSVQSVDVYNFVNKRTNLFSSGIWQGGPSWYPVTSTILITSSSISFESGVNLSIYNGGHEVYGNNTLVKIVKILAYK